MLAYDLIKLGALMERTTGSLDVTVGLIDGPVDLTHPDLADAAVREVGESPAPGSGAPNAARLHGTFVAGMLAAARGSAAPAICPGCRFIVCPILGEPDGPTDPPRATAAELATAIVTCVDAGATVVNLSLGLEQHASESRRALQRLNEALDYAAARGTILVAAAGNRSAVRSSPITRHPWVIPVAACDLLGRPADYSDLSGSIGRQGLRAPGTALTSLAPGGSTAELGGTSVAAPLVTGAVALLSSIVPAAGPAEVRRAIAGPPSGRRSIAPPVLDAERALRDLHERRRSPAYA